MAVLTVGELIDKAESFEKQLELYWADLRDRATNDGVRLVTYYLARRKNHLPSTLESYSQAQLERIRYTPFKYEDHDLNLEKCFENKDLPSSVDADRAIGVAIELVENLLSFYKHLSEQPLGPEAQQLFQCLLKIEVKDVIELKKIRATHYF